MDCSILYTFLLAIILLFIIAVICYHYTNIDQNKQKIMQSKVKQWQQKFVDSIITLRVGKTKVAKEEFYDAKKKQ